MVAHEDAAIRTRDSIGDIPLPDDKTLNPSKHCDASAHCAD
jgi:hypothetical protein